MAITLQYSTTTLTLHPDLFWSDENSWYPVEQTAQRTISGALVVQAKERLMGRPITLQPVDDSSGWIKRDVLDTLRAWAAVPGRQMTLTFNGTSYTVIFRHQDGAIEATHVLFSNDVDDQDWFLVTLRFIQIA